MYRSRCYAPLAGDLVCGVTNHSAWTMNHVNPMSRRAIRDPQYMRWIRSQGCVICTGPHRCPGADKCERFRVFVLYGRTEAAHVGLRGLGQKCSDRETIPLCAWHHRLGAESHHKLGKKFWEHHGLNRNELIAQFQARYAEAA